MNEIDLNAIEASALPNFRFRGGDLGSVVTAFLPYVFFAAGAILLFVLITSGLQLMTAGGDQKALAAAKSRLTYAALGFILVFSAYWIVQAVGLILALPDITSIFGGP